jgi:hypothetical protein
MTKTQQLLDNMDMQDLEFGHKFRELKKFTLDMESRIRKLHEVYKIAIDDAMSYGPSESDADYVALDQALDEYLKE